MKAIIKSKMHQYNEIWNLVVELIPENISDKKAIQNVENVQASESEHTLVGDTVLMAVAKQNYSVVKHLQNRNSLVVVEAFLN
jgi:hypothetical protein